MATYYVRADGNDSNTGLGPASNQAWRTIQKALGATGIASGDIVYIAPGHYNELVTVGGTYSAETQIIGDPTASQFSGVSAGFVKLSQFSSTGTAARNISQLISATGKNYLHFQNIYFEMASDNANYTIVISGRFTKLTNCVFYNNTKPSISTYNDIDIGPSTGGLTGNTTISNCLFFGVQFVTVRGATPTGDTSSIKNCVFIGSGGQGFVAALITLTMYNCSFLYCATACRVVASSTVNASNCLISQCATGFLNQGTLTENYNRFIGNTSNVTNTGTYNAGANSTAVGIVGVEAGYSLLHNLTNAVMFGSVFGSQNTSFGTASGAPATDLFGVTWTGTSPDAGAITYRNIGAFTAYNPTERNASTITIAPGSTSQSIELYLGVTGLTASTIGLTARYNRTRTASVSIPLVARTIAQAWTAGGFAEVDATNMPGVYRLDLPDAALAAGADDVTIVVRGASGTNGAVMTVKLSSGGLSSTETAQAVWNATASSYNTAGSMGEAGQKLTGYSLASSQSFSTTGSVGSVTGSVGSVTGSVIVGTNNDKTGYALSTTGVSAVSGKVWDETRSTHTTAGTFGEYVNAELVTPVSTASLVYMGPYQVIADGATTPMPLDIQMGSVQGISVQLVDNNLSGISITGATITAKVYNAGGSLVATYSGTITYAADGRATFTIDTTVTNTPGTYTATITRTTGASDTQVFGPLRIYVRDI